MNFNTLNNFSNKRIFVKHNTFFAKSAYAHKFFKGVSFCFLQNHIFKIVVRLVGPVSLINLADKASANRDYLVTSQDITDWEEKYGEIPKGAIVSYMNY